MGVKFVLCIDDTLVEVDPEGFFRVVRSLTSLFQYDDDIYFNFEECSLIFYYWKETDQGEERRLLGKIILY